MKVPREWQDEPEVFEAVMDCLDGSGVEGSEMDAQAYDEEGSYGERGYIVLTLGTRRFRLELAEII